MLTALSNISVKRWDVFLLGYCFIASILPVWLLLQPRGYLGGGFLYGTMLASLIGVLFGGYHINYPGFNLDGFISDLVEVQKVQDRFSYLYHHAL